MAARAEKAHRIGALRARMPHMSQAAYSAMLEAGRNGELDDLHGALRRAEVRRSRDAASQTQTIYGALHEEIPLSDDLAMEVCAPAAMLAHASTLGPIRRLLERALASTESRRLNLILYADEVTPGNNLAHKHARKTWAWYWSVQEFGPAALASEDAWFQCASLRTTVVGELDNGSALMYTRVLELFWPTSGGHNLSTAGIMLFGELTFFDLGVFIHRRLCDRVRTDPTGTDRWSGRFRRYHASGSAGSQPRFKSHVHQRFQMGGETRTSGCRDVGDMDAAAPTPPTRSGQCAGFTCSGGRG